MWFFKLLQYAFVQPMKLDLLWLLVSQTTPSLCMFYIIRFKDRFAYEIVANVLPLSDFMKRHVQIGEVVAHLDWSVWCDNNMLVKTMPQFWTAFFIHYYENHFALGGPSPSLLRSEESGLLTEWRDGLTISLWTMDGHLWFGKWSWNTPTLMYLVCCGRNNSVWWSLWSVE